jgi:hypothetical protein
MFSQKAGKTMPPTKAGEQLKKHIAVLMIVKATWRVASFAEVGFT